MWRCAPRYKQTVISEACPLGYGARVFTAPGAPPGADAYGVAGIYDRTIGPDGIPVDSFFFFSGACD